jgi:extracellular solute-binding protein family 5
MRRKLSSGQKIARKFTRLSKKAGAATLEHVEENIVDRFSHVQRVRLLVLEWFLLVAAIIFLSITQAYWYTDSYSVSSYKYGGTYTEATLGEVKTLNPLFASTNSEKTLAKLLFASLSMNDYSGHSGYDLAESIKNDEAGKTWTVKLRKGLKWSDGNPLTNDDVIFTASLIKNPLVNSNYTSNLRGVTVKEDESKNLVFTLSVPSAYFKSALDFPILPKHILSSVSPELLLEHTFSNKPIGSGPFVYNHTQSIGTAGEKIVYLQANQKYYKNAPLLNSFIVHAFLDKTAIVTALNNGTVTASGEIDGEFLDKIDKTNLNEKQTAVNYGVFAFLNMDRLSSRDLRQALRQGMNLKTVRENLAGVTPLDYPILDSQIQLDYPKLPEYDRSASEKTIKSLLEQNAELDKTGIVIATLKSGSLPKVSEKIASEIRSLGLKAEVVAYDPGQDFIINTLAPRNYDILVYEIGLGANPDVFAYYHSSNATQNGHNLSNYRNAVVSDLVLSARSTMNQDLRAKKYERFLGYFVNDVPAIGLYRSGMNYFSNKNIRSYSQENRLVTPTDRLQDVYRWGIEKTTKNRTP